MALDTQLFLLLNSLAGKSAILDGLIVFCASYLAYILVLLFLMFVIVSVYSRREKLIILLVTGLSCIIARGGVTELIRFFYHRPRPFLTLEAHPLLTDSAWSFPSGHATFFFALATAVYLYNKQWGKLFFTGAVLVAVGRVVAGVHYPSDSIAGAFIGIVVAYLTFLIITKLLSTRTASQEPSLRPVSDTI